MDDLLRRRLWRLALILLGLVPWALGLALIITAHVSQHGMNGSFWPNLRLHSPTMLGCGLLLVVATLAWWRRLLDSRHLIPG